MGLTYGNDMKNVEGGRDRNTPEVVCVNKWNSVCLNGRVGQGKPSRR